MVIIKKKKKKPLQVWQKKTPRIQRHPPKRMNSCASKRKSLAPSNCDIVCQVINTQDEEKSVHLCEVSVR